MKATNRCQRNLCRLLSVALLPSGCSTDEDESVVAASNQVSYSIDGVKISVEAGLSFAVVDETKHLLGPNTHLYFEAGVPSSVSDRILGDKLRINIPRAAKKGIYPVRFKGLPGANDVWISYRHSRTDIWTAYEGSLVIEELGGIGGRLRARFDTLKLSNACGEERTLSNGFIDVKIGAEAVFPASEVDLDIGSAWQQYGTTEQRENAALLELDGTLYACDLAWFDPPSVSQVESVLDVTSICACGYDPSDNSERSRLTFLASIPVQGEGLVVADGASYYVELLLDTNGTPQVPADDEYGSTSDATQWDYHQVGEQPGKPVDIELAKPITFSIFDVATTKTLSYAHLYGLVTAEE